jgi:hypothetical protein
MLTATTFDGGDRWIAGGYAVHRWGSHPEWFNVWFYGFRPESGSGRRKRVPQPISGGYPLPNLEMAEQFIEFHHAKLADLTRAHGKHPPPDALRQFECDVRGWLSEHVDSNFGD